MESVHKQTWVTFHEVSDVACDTRNLIGKVKVVKGCWHKLVNQLPCWFALESFDYFLMIRRQLTIEMTHRLIIP